MNGRSIRRAILASAATAMVLFGASAGLADQNDVRLDAMFNRLHELTDLREAQQIETAIWQVWGESGSATADLLLARGERAMAIRNLDVALDAFSALITLEPDFAEGWNKRATVFFMMGDLDASIADIERTLELAPRHFGALSGLGQIYVIMDRPKDAMNAYRRALAANPYLRGIRSTIEALQDQIGEQRI